MRVRFATFCLILCSWIGASVAQDVPVLTPGDLPNGSILSTDHYGGQALFGYIDGGAELYLEYGFKDLGRQEITSENENLVLEIYRMAGANEAYGIFSVQRFKCVPVDSLSPYTCLSKYQLQAVVGSCYLSIVNSTGSTTAQKASVDVYHAIRAKLKPRDLELPALFRSGAIALHLGNLIMAFGPLGVQNGFSDWDSLFQTIPRFRMALLPLESGNDRLTLAHIQFASEGECKEFCRRVGFPDVAIGRSLSNESGGLARVVRRLKIDEVYFGESTTSFPGRESLLELLSK